MHIHTLLYLFPFFLSTVNSVKGVEENDQENTPKDYTNYKLLRISPKTEDNRRFLWFLYQTDPGYELDFWQPPTQANAYVDVLISPTNVEKFVRELDSRQIEYFIAINDLQKAIHDERTTNDSTTDGAHLDTHFLRFDRYNNLDQIEEYLFRIREEHPKIVSIVEIGRTYENRSMYLMKLGKKMKETPSDRPAIWIDATIHAREWIAPAVSLIFIDKLVKYYGSDEQITQFIDQIDWYILPVMNPDGYAYSHSKNRMWRKNRRPTSCLHKTHSPLSAMCCTGVDLNRNFDWFWGTTGSSADPCADTYHGVAPFSENESKAVKDFLEQNNMTAFVTMHSYSQFWLIPYGHKKRAYPHDFHSRLKPLALKATKALNKLYGTKYAVGTGADLMYEASGASHDYAKGTLQIPYAYLLELRPQNTMFANGFLLPEREIQPTAEETFEAIKVVAQEILDEADKLNQIPVSPSTLPYTTTPTTSTPVTEEEIVVVTEETTPPTLMTTQPPTDPPTEQTEEPPTTIPEPPEPTTTTVLTTEASVTISTNGRTLPPPNPSTQSPGDSSNSGENSVIQPHRIIQCANHGRYCKWWKIHSLCENDRVRKLCQLSCLPECAVR